MVPFGRNSGFHFPEHWCKMLRIIHLKIPVWRSHHYCYEWEPPFREMGATYPEQPFSPNNKGAGCIEDPKAKDSDGYKVTPEIKLSRQLNFRAEA